MDTHLQWLFFYLKLKILDMSYNFILTLILFYSLLYNCLLFLLYRIIPFYKHNHPCLYNYKFVEYINFWSTCNLLIRILYYLPPTFIISVSPGCSIISPNFIKLFIVPIKEVYKLIAFGSGIPNIKILE